MINTITHAEFPHGDLGGGVLTEAHPRLTRQCDEDLSPRQGS
jgi:hypothetical protein